MKKIKGILIDVKNEEVKIVEVEKSLRSYYKILDCNTIDIVSRKIGNKCFDIVCDDEGLFKSPQKISAIDNFGTPRLVGNLFIVKFDERDDITSLDQDEIEYVMKRIVKLSTYNFPNGYPMLTGLNWR